MKKNMKGFTLIELLAVIVILAVIALIATPIIMNVINDAKVGAERDGAYGVVKAVETAVAQEMVTNISYKVPTSCTIAVASNVVKCGTLVIDVKGTKPTGGVIKFNTKGAVDTGSTVIMPGNTFTLTAEGKF